MSSNQVTISEFIGMLQKYPPDLLVAIPNPYLDPDIIEEGIYDGPTERCLYVIPVHDARSGFTPTALSGREDFKALVIHHG